MTDQIDGMLSRHCLLPIFDKADRLSFNGSFPPYLSQFLPFEKDYLCAHAFLYAYKASDTTFNAYRREIERLLHWSWQILCRSVLVLSRTDIENFVKFCQRPPHEWIGTHKPPRFTTKNGVYVPNHHWRPFVVTVSKDGKRKGLSADKKQYQLSNKAVQAMFAILSSFYQFLIQERYTEINPVMSIRQKSQFIRKQQDPKKIRRLTTLQWSYVIDTARKLADNDKKHERTLFMISSLYLMYLRISELAASSRWIPQMNDFKRDHDGLWWFTTVGKGNKERQIAVSDAMLEVLKRWRVCLGLTPLPSPDDQTPLLPALRGHAPLTSTNQIRNIVQYCFDQAIEDMISQGFKDEVSELRAATVHWLRHTGISDDIKHRPREHVRDDAGHSSSQTTDHYIDIDRRERHYSAKKKNLITD